MGSLRVDRRRVSRRPSFVSDLDWMCVITLVRAPKFEPATGEAFFVVGSVGAQENEWFNLWMSCVRVS